MSFLDLLNKGIAYAREYDDRQKAEDEKRRAYELQTQRLRYQFMQTQKSAELAAAERVNSKLENDTVKTVVMWLITALASTVIGAVVLDIIKK